jgi:NADH:ubiquinone oxidoreductase subunit 4 (subunit M)
VFSRPYQARGTAIFIDPLNEFTLIRSMQLKELTLIRSVRLKEFTLIRSIGLKEFTFYLDNTLIIFIFVLGVMPKALNARIEPSVMGVQQQMAQRASFLTNREALKGQRIELGGGLYATVK